MINFVIHVYIKFDRLKYFNQVLSLEYIRQIGWWSLLFNSRKFLLLYLEAWKYICYLLIIISHFSFLLNSHDILLGRTGPTLRYFDFLSTNKYEDHLILSEQSQKVIGSLEFLLKKYLRSLDIIIECSWNGWTDILSICLATRMVLVIMMISVILLYDLFCIL